MGSTCQCQKNIDDDQYMEEPLVEEGKKDQLQEQLQDKIDDDQEQQKIESQTIEIDPIQLKSYEIEDNLPQGLQSLTVQAQQEFLDQFPAVVKKMMKKMGKLKIKANLSQNYLKIPNIEEPYQLVTGDIYVGQWVEGKPYGLGKIYYADFQVYEGQVIDSIPDGEGRKIFKDGSCYTGQFKMGEINGRGLFEKSKNGFKYEGEFLNGRPDGMGIETWPDLTTYQGQYILGKKQGKGTFTWGNRKSKSTGKQETYVGDFKNDVFHGSGRYEWQDGRVYDGEWVEGKMEGKGEFIWPDKRKYIGGYLKDFKSGYGVLEWPDGKKLSGHWRLGKLNGNATLTIQGKLKEGEKEREPDKTFLSEWEDGKRIRWVDNLQPSGMHSNVSYQRGFDEHQQNLSQMLPSQIRQDDQKSNFKESNILGQLDQQQQKTIFQSQLQKQTQEDSQSQKLQQLQIKQNQVQEASIQQNNDNIIKFNNDNQFDQQPNNIEVQQIEQQQKELDPSKQDQSKHLLSSHEQLQPPKMVNEEQRF